MVEANFTSGMTNQKHYPDLASDTYGISVLVSQITFRGETVGGISKYRLFSQAKDHIANHTWKELVFFQLQLMYPEPGKCLEHQKILKCPLEGHLHPKVTV